MKKITIKANMKNVMSFRIVIISVYCVCMCIYMGIIMMGFSVGERLGSTLNSYGRVKIHRQGTR